MTADDRARRRAVRLGAAWTTADAAKAVGVSRVAFTGWESGRTVPRAKHRIVWDALLAKLTQRRRPRR